MGDVALRAVGIVANGDDRVCLFRGFEREFIREHPHARHLGAGGWLPRCTLDDPLAETGEVGVIGRELAAAAVRHRVGRLLEEQAVVGVGEIDPAIDEFPRESEVIDLGVESKEREPKPLLAPGGAVAAAGIAAIPHQDRHHLGVERDLGGLRRNGVGLGLTREALNARRDRRVYWLGRGVGMQAALGPGEKVLIGRGHGSLCSDVTVETLVINVGYHQSLVRRSRADAHLVRPDVEFGGGGDTAGEYGRRSDVQAWDPAHRFAHGLAHGLASTARETMPEETQLSPWVSLAALLLE